MHHEPDRAMRFADALATGLLVLGGINWGLQGLFHFDLVGRLFGGKDSAGARAVYALVGAAAVYELAAWPSMQRRRRQVGEQVRRQLDMTSHALHEALNE